LLLVERADYEGNLWKVFRITVLWGAAARFSGCECRQDDRIKHKWIREKHSQRD
jgi:hypothetical protein